MNFFTKNSIIFRRQNRKIFIKSDLLKAFDCTVRLTLQFVSNNTVLFVTVLCVSHEHHSTNISRIIKTIKLFNDTEKLVK